jgi:C-terminal processing protease CtpA/Prc
MRRATPALILRLFTSLSTALLLLFATRENVAAQPASTSLGPAERQRVMDAVVGNLQRYYFDPAVARRTATALRAHQRSGDYATRDGAEFAALLTKHMREASQDMNLDVMYSHDPLPFPQRQPSSDAIARYRRDLEQANCNIAKVDVLQHKIGYLKLDSFPEPATCSGKVAAAMSSLDQADAVIFDLRANRGGYPDMVSFVASYLFDHPEYIFNPREAPSQQSWTRSPVPGSHFAHKRVYILTSSATFSGAEQFCYNMKMLKRAVLVGETTGGGAHAGVFHRIDDHFGMGISEVKVVNPYSDKGWEGVGVEPDVKVKAADALETAMTMAEKESQNQAPRP